MQIGQLATMAGTTVRTIRHYHRLGLLTEPSRLSNGYRNYTGSDVVRLMRIRWLAASGVPLGSVSAILAEERSQDDERDVVADLRALVRGIEDEQATLARRSAALKALLADAEQGKPISALPSSLASSLAEVIAAAPSFAIGAALRQERDLFEALVLSGKVPTALLTGYEATLSDDNQRERYMAVLGHWSDLEGRRIESATEEIDLLVDILVESIDDLDSSMFASEDDMTANGSADAQLCLDDVIPDPAQREVVLRAQEKLLARSRQKDS